MSHTSSDVPSELEKTTEQLTGSPADVAAILEKRGFAHLYIDGGSTIRGFSDAGLIDSLILTRVPILLGSGISLFDGLQSEVGLDHITTRSFDSGLVQSEYRVAHTNAESE